MTTSHSGRLGEATMKGLQIVVVALAALAIPRLTWAHAGNSDAGMVHACIGNISKVARVVGVGGQCIAAPPLIAETPAHWPQTHGTVVQGPKGDTGPAGPAGATGLQGVAGPAGPRGADGAPGPAGTSVRWRGEFSCAATYEPRDVISYQGSAWITNVTIGGCVNPPFTPWEMLASKGDKGDPGTTGVAGPQGPPGLMGLQGPPGPQGPAGSTARTMVIKDFDVPPPPLTGWVADYVACPANFPKVVSGGAFVLAPQINPTETNPLAYVTESIPNGDAAWWVRVFNNTGRPFNPITVTMRLQAVCSN